MTSELAARALFPLHPLVPATSPLTASHPPSRSILLLGSHQHSLFRRRSHPPSRSILLLRSHQHCPFRRRSLPPSRSILLLVSSLFTPSLSPLTQHTPRERSVDANLSTPRGSTNRLGQNLQPGQLGHQGRPRRRRLQAGPRKGRHAPARIREAGAGRRGLAGGDVVGGAGGEADGPPRRQCGLDADHRHCACAGAEGHRHRQVDLAGCGRFAQGVGGRAGLRLALEDEQCVNCSSSSGGGDGMGWGSLFFVLLTLGVGCFSFRFFLLFFVNKLCMV